jgi:cellulose synthase (UDP-forming)
VHAVNAIAHGAGPQTFADLVTQEFQWSRSLATILLKYTPLYFGRLPIRLKLQFAFLQLWYPIFSVIMMIMYLLPLAALFLDSNLVGVTYPSFFARISLIWIVVCTMSFWWRRQHWLRPVDARTMTWEGALYMYARWPWSLIGTIAAVRDCIKGNTLEFRVTPKGCASAEPLPFRVLAPYAFLSLVSGLPVVLLGNVKVAVGFYLFAAANSALYALLMLVIIFMHKRENPKRENPSTIVLANLIAAPMES